MLAFQFSLGTSWMYVLALRYVRSGWSEVGSIDVSKTKFDR